MSTEHHFELKPEQDGCGYFYGRFDVGDASYRIDVLPPTSLPKPFFVMASVQGDPKLWVVHVDGNEIGRTETREQIEALIVAHLASDQLDLASSASRQHFIDTGRYLRKDETDPG